MYRGDPARNATTFGQRASFSLCWRIPLVEGMENAQIIKNGLRSVAAAQRVATKCRRLPMLPGLHPLAVGDSVLMRTSQTLWAIDFNTGKRLWEAPLDKPANGQSLAQGGKHEDGFKPLGGPATSLRGSIEGFRLWHAE